MECKRLAFKDTQDYLTKIRKDYGYEGAVLYFLDQDYNVIGLLKKKTAWYIIIRAVREKLRRHISPKNTESIDELKNRVSYFYYQRSFKFYKNLRTEILDK